MCVSSGSIEVRGRASSAPATYSAYEVRRLVTFLEAGTLLREEWTRETRLLVALYYVAFHDHEAEERLCRAIQLHPELGMSYHETITVAWLRLVRWFARVYGYGGSFADLGNGLLAVFAGDALPAYYSRERLHSPEARNRFLEPDLQELPHSIIRAVADAPWIDPRGPYYEDLAVVAEAVESVARARHEQQFAEAAARQLGLRPTAFAVTGAPEEPGPTSLGLRPRAPEARVAPRLRRLLRPDKLGRTAPTPRAPSLVA